MLGVVAEVGVVDVPPAVELLLVGEATAWVPVVDDGAWEGDCGWSGPDAWSTDSSLMMTLLRCKRAVTRFSSMGESLEAC